MKPFDPSQEPLPDFVRVLHPPESGTDVFKWVQNHRASIHDKVEKAGALLLRGWPFGKPEDLEKFVNAVANSPWNGIPQLFTTRKHVQGVVHTSTEYDPSHRITLHSEFSHNPFRTWPMRLYFFCQVASTTGGETHICNNRKVFKKIPTEFREEFLKRGLTYRRIFYPEETQWQNVFKTEDRNEVESRCRASNIDFEWRNNLSELKLTWKLHSIAKHPKTADDVWFNQAHTIAFEAIAPQLKQHFLERYGYEQRPMDVTFSDGGSIPVSWIKQIAEIHDSESIGFRWKAGDILILDNMLTGHGRQPYTGERRVLVGMSDETNSKEVHVE